jgi:hypothetical protein
VKENLKKRGLLFDGNNIDLGETVNEAELIEEMNQINDVKYDVLAPLAPGVQDTLNE